MRSLTLALLVVAALPARLSAQWVVDLSAGSASHETVGADVGSRSAMFGVRHDGPLWLYLYGGAPLDSAGLPWGAAGAGGRIEAARSGRSLGADAAAQLHGYRDRRISATGSGLTAELLPFVALSAGNARLELHTGGRVYTASFADTTFRRSVLDHGAQLTYASAGGVLLAGGARLMDAPEGSYPEVTAGVQLARTAGTAWATAGRWFSDDLSTTSWAVGGSLALARRFDLELSFQQEGSDPLYWNEPRRSWSVGIAHALSPRRASAAPVGVPMSEASADGLVTIRLPRDAAAAPAVGGDFNDWKPVAMTLERDEWVAKLPLASGVYRYAFRAADGDWFVPESVPGREEDGFGGYSAVLIVP